MLKLLVILALVAALASTTSNVAAYRAFAVPRRNNTNTLVGDLNGGAWLSAHNSIFAILTPFINQLIVSEVSNIGPIAPISQDHFDLTNIAIDSLTCTECVALSLTNSGAAQLAVNGASASAHLDWKYARKLIHPHGHCSPHIEDLSVLADVTFDTPLSTGQPQVKITIKDFKIGKLKMECSGILGDLVDAITTIFKGLIDRVIASHLIGNLVTKTLNKKLAGLNLKFAFDKGFAQVDFGVTSSVISSGAAVIAVVGKITPVAKPDISFPFGNTPPALKDTCAGLGMVGIGLSEWTLNTAGYAFFIYNKIDFTAPSIIKAGDLKLLIPGFDKELGSDAMLNLTIAAASYPNFDSVPSTNSLAVTIPLNLTITGDKGTRYQLQALGTAGVSVLLGTNTTNPTINFNVQTLSLTNPKTIYSNVGGIGTLPLVIDLLDGLIGKLLSFINKYFLDHGIPLPTLDGFALSSTGSKIVYNDNSICVAASIRVV